MNEAQVNLVNVSNEGVRTPAKAGVRTTEFWVAVAAQLLCGAAVVWADSDVARLGGMLGAALVSSGYGMARARVKAGG